MITNDFNSGLHNDRDGKPESRRYIFCAPLAWSRACDTFHWLPDPFEVSVFLLSGYLTEYLCTAEYRGKLQIKTFLVPKVA